MSSVLFSNASARLRYTVDMRKTLVILFAVAVLGILATYIVPDVNKNTAGPTSQTLVQPTSISSATDSGRLPTAAASDASTAASTYRDGTYTGTTATSRYGDVKVSLSITDGKITAVSLDTLSIVEEHSNEINAYAVPRLKEQTLSAQNARISGVSGATFTSSSYIRSLQSALDKARSS